MMAAKAKAIETGFLIATVLSAHALKRSGVAGGDAGKYVQRDRHRLSPFSSRPRLRLTLVVVSGPMGASEVTPTLLQPRPSGHQRERCPTWCGGQVQFSPPGGRPEHALRRNIINMEKRHGYTW
jgi:hypothetical protein